jgi:hypothetical protein
VTGTDKKRFALSMGEVTPFSTFNIPTGSIKVGNPITPKEKKDDFGHFTSFIRENNGGQRGGSNFCSAGDHSRRRSN